ncbi:hypothetical protein ACTMU2_33985 [Cupriavidus basilensis]
MPYTSLDEAIALNNASAHGLSSCIFTESLREAGALPVVSGQRLRHRQRQYRHQRGGDWRRIRRREGNRRRAGIGVGRVERLYAARDQHDQLRRYLATGAGYPVRDLSRRALAALRSPNRSES